MSLHAKVVVFELQCPACIRIWRSAAPRLLRHFYQNISYHGHRLEEEEEQHLLAHIPALQPYFEDGQGPLLVYTGFAYFCQERSHSWHDPILRYVVHHPVCGWSFQTLSAWQSGKCYAGAILFDLRRGSDYINNTSHTSNHVLSAQADCPADLSLDEFIAFAHLRSGGSLQWLNILQGLCSRTLNFHREEVHYLLAHAVSQVGPLDLSTGVWIWHQELQDSYFCNALLDELNSLFMDVGAGLIDGVFMGTISLLLARVIASSPSQGVSDRAIALLQGIRRKTFSWVQDLSYDLAQAPTNEERRHLLLDMAATCRSTFDVDPGTLHKLFHSPEDIDALLSCAFFIHALPYHGMSNS